MNFSTLDSIILAILTVGFIVERQSAAGIEPDFPGQRRMPRRMRARWLMIMPRELKRTVIAVLLVVSAWGLAGCKPKHGQAPPPAHPDTEVMLGIVALAHAQAPDPARILAYLQQQWLDDYQLSPLDTKEGISAFSIKGDSATIAYSNRPLSWSDLEGPCANAAFWPEAAEVMKQHQAHVVIAVVGKLTEDRIDRLMLLTRLTAAAAANSDAGGIFWPAGGVVNSPKDFLEMTRSMKRGKLPLALWVEIAITANPDGSLKAWTQGMDQFKLPDIEVPRCGLKAEVLYGKIYDIAHYLIQNGPVLNDGDSAGEDETEQIRIKHAPSMFDPNRQVIVLEFQP